jgi:hypothetical protein
MAPEDKTTLQGLNTRNKPALESHQGLEKSHLWTKFIKKLKDFHYACLHVHPLYIALPLI